MKYDMKPKLSPLMRDVLASAVRLTSGGGLMKATAAIQRALGDAMLPTAHAPSDPVLEADSRTPGSQFVEGAHEVGADVRHYKLFVPSGFEGRPLPLVVMLHGCTQDPDDFAAGTRMNTLAQERGFLVLYPAQPARSNASKCWNWFEPGDQRRGSGEPALLAGMTRHIIATRAVDPDRVYVAGLSAGGAMAAILGAEYPDLFSAIGVHSGLPRGAAHDIPSAFAAMKGSSADVARPPSIVPTIVFHGDDDATVHPRNGEQVIRDLRPASSMAQNGRKGHGFTRTIHRDADGNTVAEHWQVHGAGHAWSGGSTDGSYADPAGPDASREMLRFFLEHPRVCT